jgi:Fe2+ transport system protein FeoA
MNPNIETTLENAKCGKAVRVTRLADDHGAQQRLCELGFCENACIRKIIHGTALICSVAGVRVAISAALAGKIFVREIACNI